MRARFLAVMMISIMAIPGYLAAAIVDSTGTVGFIDSYSTYGSGDVVFKLSSQATGCADGYWLKVSDPGFKSNYAMLLAAKAAGLSMRVFADNSDIWGGSATGIFCRVDTLRLL